MTTFTEGPDSSVKIAVHNEAQRRKRAFRMYLALLIVPIAIGAYAIANAPSQTQAVAKEVIPVVNANVQETIKPQVAEAVAAQAGPIIQASVDQQIGRNVDNAVALRIKPVEARIDEMLVRSGNDMRVKELEDRVGQLEKQVQILARELQARREGRDTRTMVPVKPKPQ